MPCLDSAKLEGHVAEIDHVLASQKTSKQITMLQVQGSLCLRVPLWGLSWEAKGLPIMSVPNPISHMIRQFPQGTKYHRSQAGTEQWIAHSG